MMISEKELEIERIGGFEGRYIFSRPQHNRRHPSAKVYDFIKGPLYGPRVLPSSEVALLRTSGVLSRLCRPNLIVDIFGKPTLVFATIKGTQTVLDTIRIGGMRASSVGVTNGLEYGMPILVIPSLKTYNEELEVGQNPQAVYAHLAGAYYQFTGKKIV